MNGKIKIVILTLLIAEALPAAARILEVNNDQLYEDFRGSSPGAISRDDLREELNTRDGPELIRKFLADDRLKRTLYEQIPNVQDETTRDGLLVVCLRDSENWAVENNGMRDPRASHASLLIKAVYDRFPAMRDDEEQIHALVCTFMTPQGRETVAAAYQKFLESPPKSPDEAEVKKAQLLAGLKAAMANYGTEEFVHPRDPNLPPEAYQPRVFGDGPFKKTTMPISPPPVVNENAAPKPVTQDLPWLLWAVGGVFTMIIVTLVLCLLRYRTPAQKRDE